MGMQQAHPHNAPSDRGNRRTNEETSRLANGDARRPRWAGAVPLLHSTYFQFSIAGLAGLFLLITVGFAALGREIYPEGTVPSGVAVAGVDIGELSDDEARALLEQQVASYSGNPFVLTFGDQTWEPSMADLGARFDISQTVDDANVSSTPMQRVRTRVLGAEERDLPLRMSLDDDQLNQYIASIAQEIDEPAKVPELAIADGQVTVTEAVRGIEVNQQVLAESVTSSLYNLENDPIDIQYQEVEPEYTDEDVQAVREQINQALSQPLSIRFEDRSWTIEPTKMAEFLSLTPDESGQMQLAVDQEPLIAHLDQLIVDVNRPARNAKIAWGGSSVVATSPSQTGIERDIYALVPKLEEAIANGEHSIELTYYVTRPAIDSENLGDLGIDGLMAQGQSAFWNSAPSRANNIGVAAGYLDGTVIPPGHEFSFNNSIGEISVERGYQEGYVIQAEATVPGIGGGVCQVSTTAFRAAFMSGLPITERHPHAYLVGFYEQGDWPLGFDAAIFQPDLDFRFANTTDGYILVHTHVEGENLYINLYGPELGYNVEIGEPVIENETEPPADVEVVDEDLAPGERRQVEAAKPGMEVTLPRTVTNSAGEVVRQDYFYSNFQAWGNRFLVGPSTSNDAQAPSEAPAAGEPSGEIIEAEDQVETEPAVE
ncbi:MAG: VanW family protein [Thermomicrobiaceae bacterium]